MYPQDIQGLFQGYINSQITNICEWSGSISDDMQKLKDWAINFAITNNFIISNELNNRLDNYILNEG